MTYFVNTKIQQKWIEGKNSLRKVQRNPFKEMDWRKYQAVPDVRFINNSEDTVALAASSSVFALAAINKGHGLQVSPEQILKCIGKDEPSLNECFDYIKDNKLCSVGRFNYENETSCERLENCTLDYRPGHVNNMKSENSLLLTLNLHPVIVKICDTPFNNGEYKGGIYDDIERCNQCPNNEPNRYVLAIGYGEENGIDYWLIQESRGRNWGESGYLRLKRGVSSDGICGIAKEIRFPYLYIFYIFIYCINIDHLKLQLFY